MSNINNFYKCSTLSHDLPPAWSKGTITEFAYSQEINNLLSTLNSGHFTIDDIHKLRKNHNFKCLYQKMHMELEQGTGVIFISTTIFKQVAQENVNHLFINFGHVAVIIINNCSYY